MKLRNIQLRSKEKSVKVQKKQSGPERMRKLRKKNNKTSILIMRDTKQERERIANIRKKQKWQRK